MHNLFSPSSAHIWRHCLQSKILTTKHKLILPDLSAAMLGNDWHDYFNVEAVKLIRSKFKHLNLVYNKSIKPPKRLIDNGDYYIKQALSSLHDRLIQLSGMLTKRVDTVYLESRWPLAINNISIGGTSDVTLIGKEEIFVYDLKTGYLKVNTKDNEQLILYAKGALNAVLKQQRNIKKIHLGILQPRLRHYDYLTTLLVQELNKKYFEITQRLRNYVEDFNPGKHCKYCPSKLACPVIREGVKIMLDYKNNQQITKEKQIKLLTIKDGLVRLLDELEQTYVNKMLFGEEVEGLELNKGEKYGKTHYRVVKS